MSYSLEYKKDSFIDKSYKKSIKELNDFFELDWKENLPIIFLVKDRITINQLQGKKTEDWVCGWVKRLNVFVLHYSKIKDYTRLTKKEIKERYSKLIKHELTHCFFQVFSGIIDKPIRPKWISEGVAFYLAKQNNRKPEKFSEFLDYYDTGGRGIYMESAFVIEILVKKFGKQKLLNLIKNLKILNSKDEFDKLFKKIYGFDLNYDNINRLWKNHKR